MRFGFKQPLVGEKRCVTTLITAAEETRVYGNAFKIDGFNMWACFLTRYWVLLRVVGSCLM